eukprot:14143275-Ditylum_brightwellii.AAC.2
MRGEGVEEGHDLSWVLGGRHCVYCWGGRRDPHNRRSDIGIDGNEQGLPAQGQYKFQHRRQRMTKTFFMWRKARTEGCKPGIALV